MVGAIAGLVRLLADGRVPAEEHARVMHSLQNATERAAGFTRDLGEIARWSRTDPHAPRQSIALGAILDRALARAEGTPSIVPELDGAGECLLSVMDVEAMVEALTALARAARRVATDGIVCRVRTSASHADVMLGPPAVEWLPERERRPFEVASHGGLGLSVLLAATIVDAHRGRTFQDGSGTTLGVHLPLNRPSITATT